MDARKMFAQGTSAGVLLLLSVLSTSAAELPERLLVNPSQVTDIEKQAFERGAIVIYGSSTYDPVTGQRFNVQILEGGKLPPMPSGPDDPRPNGVPRYVERPVSDSPAGQTLNIALRPPRAGERWTIVLTGIIDPGAPTRLVAELIRHNVRAADVFLDSPGGSLGAALALGRLFRRHNMSTHIGNSAQAQAATGRCFSACVYAFIGGASRYMTEQDSLGVHRFSAGSSSENDLERAQLVSGEIARYISDMGVDVRLFQLASRVPSASMYRLGLKEALALRVANNGRQTRGQDG
jgi:hypothetical protein